VIHGEKQQIHMTKWHLWIWFYW